MAKEVKRLWAFGRLDYRAAEQYLEMQAAKGYVLKEIGTMLNLTATFEKTEPKQIKYCIDGYRGDKEGEKDYVDFAADGGWHKVATLPGQIIFASEEGKNPPPLQTDWHGEYLQIRKSLWKMDIPVGISVLIVIWIFYKLNMFLFGEMVFSVMSPVELFQSLLLFVVVALSLAIFLRAVWFYIRSEAAIRRDIPLKPASLQMGRFWGILHVVYGISILLLFIQNGVNAVEGQLESSDFLRYPILLCLGIMVLLMPKAKNEKAEQKKRKLMLGIGIFTIILSFVQCGLGW